MERFLAVYAHEDEEMDIEPVLLPVTYSSREAFLSDVMMAARDAKAAHEAWQRAAAPYQQALLQNMLRRFNQEPVIPSELFSALFAPTFKRNRGQEDLLRWSTVPVKTAFSLVHSMPVSEHGRGYRRRHW